jgi:hypothetical protein
MQLIETIFDLIIFNGRPLASLVRLAGLNVCVCLRLIFHIIQRRLCRGSVLCTNFFGENTMLKKTITRVESN